LVGFYAVIPNYEKGTAEGNTLREQTLSKFFFFYITFTKKQSLSGTRRKGRY